MNKNLRATALVPMLLLLSAPVMHSHPQDTASAAASQAISNSGLLPVYAVDVGQETGASLPQIWDALKPAGFNSIRLAVDVRDAAAAAARVAQLCVWARQNTVHLIPVLVGSDKGRLPGSDYAANVAAFAAALVKTLHNDGTAALESYAQILTFQIESQMNHAGVHGPASTEAVQQLLLQAAAALRKAEEDALKDTGLNATPILIDASFDYELIGARAIAGTALTDDAYAQARSSLQRFFAPLAASPDVDLLGVTWFPGTVSAGGVEKLPSLVRTLLADVAGKQVLITTGFSTAFRSPDEQKKFYALGFANLADLRVNEGVDSPFLGVVFHEATNGPDAAAAPPSGVTTEEMAKWDWGAKADELVRTWKGETGSAAMSWWLRRVESAMGLVAIGGTSAGASAVTAQPAQQGLTELATTIAAASTAPVVETAASTSTETATQPQASADTGPSPGSAMASALMAKAQQGLMGLLDRLFEKLGNTIAAPPSGAGTETTTAASPGAGAGAGTQPTAEGLSISLSKDDISVQPSSGVAGQPISFSVTLRNQSATADASSLVVAVVDQGSNALAYATDVSLAHGTAHTLALNWTPSEAGTYPLSVQVYDASLTTQFASAALDSISVAVAPGASAGSPATEATAQPAGTDASPSGSGSSVNVTKQDVIVQPTTPAVGDTVSFAITVRNQSAEADASGLVVAVVDEASNALAYASDVVIARGATHNLTLTWAPPAAGAYPLSVQVYDAALTVQMAIASLDPVTVVTGSGASPGSGSSGTGTGTGTPTKKIPAIDASRLARLKLFAAKNKGPVALNVSAIKVLHAAGPQQMLMAKRSSGISVSVTNFSAIPMQDVVARLLVDGQTAKTLKVGTILPKQQRHVVFPDVSFAQIGTRELKVVFETGSGKPMSSAVVTRILVTNTPVTLRTGSRVRAIAPSVRPSAPRVVLTRPIVPPKLRVGRLSPVGESSPTVRVPTNPGADAEKETPSRGRLRLPTTAEAETKTDGRRRIGPPLALRPDLSVTAADIHCDQQAPAPGAVVTCVAAVRNRGTGPAKGATIRFAVHVDGKVAIQRAFVADIGVGAQGVHVATWSFRMPPGQTVMLEAVAITSDDAQAANNGAGIALRRVRMRMRLPQQNGSNVREMSRR